MSETTVGGKEKLGEPTAAYIPSEYFKIKALAQHIARSITLPETVERHWVHIPCIARINSANLVVDGRIPLGARFEARDRYTDKLIDTYDLAGMEPGYMYNYKSKFMSKYPDHTIWLVLPATELPESIQSF